MALSIFTPARGSGNAAGAAAEHKAAAHPAHHRGEERPHLRRRGDGVEAPLRHRASSRAAPPGVLPFNVLCLLVPYMPLARIASGGVF